MCFTNLTVVNALDKRIEILATFKKDVTGDKLPDKIQIIKSGKIVKMQVISKKNKNYIINLGEVQKPSVVFQDLTQDEVKDIFISNNNKKGGEAEYYLFSFGNEQMNKISLPEGLNIIAQFENNYQASIKINQSGKAYTLDFRHQKENFEKRGLYQNGALNEPTELMVSSIHSLQLTRNKDLTFGLKGRQLVDDGYGGAKMAFVDSSWKWVNGNWELQKTSVKKIK
jgi:hypothetical protein